MTVELEKITPDSAPDYRNLIGEVIGTIWPEFMRQDPVSDLYWDGLFENFPEYQFAMINPRSREVAGLANSVPLFWSRKLEELPDEGWDWALITSAEGFENDTAPNYLCGIQISVAPDYQGQGLSRILLEEMISMARARGFGKVIIPVRPSLKSSYPLTSIQDYLEWKTDEGLPFDPWLRVHLRNGGRILHPCHRAMQITGSVADWEGWTGMHFFDSGDYIIPGALTPVRFDVEADVGEYLEPNVWVVHEVSQRLR